MSRIHRDQPLLPSVLDRLLDNDPHVKREALKSDPQLLRDLKMSVRRDLENLLNTRVCLKMIPRDLNELNKSLFNYGIPDFGGLAMGNPDQQKQLCRQIQESIVRFETRFSRVHVELVKGQNSSFDRTIRFRIDGILHAEPAPEPVVFDSKLNTISQEFSVRASDT